MGIEKLTENSTPCEICKELGLMDKEISDLRVDRIYSYKCYIPEATTCLQKDRATIKLLYLTYLNSKKE